MPDRVKGDMYVSGNITSSASVNSKDNFFRKIQKKQNTKIVCFGDSITFGYTAGNIQSAYPYPKKLQDIFSAVYNSTTTGTIALTKIYPYSEGRTIKIIGTSDTNIVAIAEGGNINIVGGSPRTLGNADVWTGTAINGSWVETAYSDN